MILVICIILIIYLFISILLLEKNVIQIWNFMMKKIEFSWSQNY